MRNLLRLNKFKKLVLVCAEMFSAGQANADQCSDFGTTAFKLHGDTHQSAVIWMIMAIMPVHRSYSRECPVLRISQAFVGRYANHIQAAAG